MRSMTFRVDDRSTDTLVPAVLVTVTENDDGTLTFSITQQGAIVGDLRGVFFDVANESLTSHLTVSAAAGLTSVQRGDDSVVDLGSGANMQGLVGSDGGYDVGLQVGTAGIGKDDYRNFSFTLGTDNGTALTLEDFANVDFGVRLTSVGTLDGARTDGAKLLETTSGPIDAIDDHASVKEDTAPGQAAGNVLSNDHGADPSQSAVVAVNGAAANVGVDVHGLYGTLHLNADGSYVYTLDNMKPAVQALAEGQEVSETFTYQARSTTEATSYSDDSASLVITVRGTNDAVQVAAVGGGSVAEDVAPHATGVVSFSDVDLSDTHVASFTPAAGNTTALGTFALGPVDEAPNAANGSVGWTYTLDNAAAQSLSEGQSITETYLVQVDDGHGSIATQSVTISIAGTNDGPTAQPISQSADEDGAPVQLHAVYSDVDALDTHSFSVDVTGTHGVVTNNGDGSFTYSPNGQFEALAEGETATDSFAYTVTDNHGASSTETATVTIQGTNDAPVATGGNTTGVVYEDGSRHADGVVTATDVDHGAVLTWSLDNAGVAATPDFRFLIDNLRIVRNGVQYFNDDFGDNAAPPSAGGVLNEAVATGTSYFTQGSFAEGGGRAIFDGSRSVPVLAPGTTDIFYGESAILSTDTSADLSRGLKIDDSFSVEGRFDLVMPGEDRQSYGVRLVDLNGSDVVDVRVRNEDGGVYVVVRESDVPGNTTTELGRIALDPAVGENQIVLRLTHDAARPGEIHASFDLLGGATTRSFAFSSEVVGHIFGTGTPGDATDDEVFTRAQIFAAGPDDVQNGTYGTLHIDANGHWNYVLDNGAANVQALAQGEHATDTFTARVTDEHGASVTQTISIEVTGSNDSPVFSTAPSSGFVVEDGPSVAVGSVAATDPDHGDTLTWSVGHAIFGPGVSSAYSADYRFALDDLKIVRNGATLFDDQFDAGGPPPSAPNFTGSTLAASYTTTGLFTEEGGKLIFDGHLAGAIPGVGDDHLIASNGATLNTNIDPADLTRGLKSDDSFTASARFDLATPAPGQFYGITLTDNTQNGLPVDQRGDDQVVILVNRDASGHLQVELTDTNLTTDTFTVLGGLSLAPLAGETQIVLRLSHDAHDVGTIHGGFDLVGPGVATRSFEFTQVGHIFGTDTPGYAGDDEDWTRVQVIARGEDNGGDTLAGTYGTMHVDQSGNWTYLLDNSLASTQSLAQNQFATDLFSIRATDEHGLSSFRSVPVTVQGTNDAPVATPAGPAVAVFEDSFTHGAASVFFTDADLTDFHMAFSNPSPTNTTALGTFSVGPVIESPTTADGAVLFTYDLNNGLAQYLADGETVQETYSVVVQDPFGASTSSDVTVSIIGTNDPVFITAADSAGTVIENVQSNASGAINFADVDLRDSHGATFTASPGNATHLGTFSLSGVDEAAGSATGSVGWTYTLDNAAAQYLAQGETATETYTVTLDDGHGSFATQDVNITIVGTEQNQNHAPVAVDDDLRGGVLPLPPLSTTEFEPNNNPFNAQYVPRTAFGLGFNPDVGDSMTVPWTSISGHIGPDNGGPNDVDMFRIDLNAGETLTLDVDHGYPDLDSVVHVFAADGTLLTVDDDFFPETVGAGGSVFGYDSYLSYTAQTSGTYYFSVSSFANFASNAFSFNNNGFYNGGDYVLNVSLQSAAGGANEDATLTVPAAQLLANDFDPDFGDTISIVSTSGTSALGASVSLVNGDVVYDPRFVAALQALDDGESATDTFTYTISDNHGATDSATVTLNIAGRNDAPVVMNDFNAASEDGPTVFGNVLANDTDPDIEPLFLANWGTFGLAHGTLTIDGAGNYSYAVTDQSLAAGTFSEDYFYYTATDGTAFTSGVLTIDVTGANDAPVAVNDHVGAAVLDFNGAVDLNNYQGFQFLNFAWDPNGLGDGDFTAIYESQFGGMYPDGSLRRVDGQNFSLDSLRVAANPFWDTLDHAITIQGYDDGIQVASGTLYLTRGVVPASYQTFSFAGDPSVDEVRFVLPHDFNFTYALLDNVRVGENIAADQATDINVLRNDFDPDAGDSISLSGFDATSAYGATLSLNADGTLHYDPLSSAQLQALNEGDVLTDTFTYNIVDSHGAVSNAATVSIDVHGVHVANNQPPVAAPDTNAADPLVEQGFAVPGFAFVNAPLATGNVLANDTDPDAGSVLHVSAVNGGSVGFGVQGTYGFLVINADGNWSYNLDNGDPDTNALAPGETGTEVFTYTVSDQHGATSSSTLTLSITGSEDSPIPQPGGDTGSVTEDGNLVASGQLSAFDPDHGAVLHWVPSGAPGAPTASYHYSVDRFTVTRNGASLFDDQFSDGSAPPSAPNFANGTAATYITRGVFTETGDRAVLDGQLAQTTFPQGLPGPVVTSSATLNTNTDSTNLAIGLKDVFDFNVAAVFDFAVPAANQLYGIGLTDQTATNPGDDLVQLVVSRDASGSALLTLRDVNNVTGTATALESTLLSASAGDEVRLVLQHQASHVGEVTAGYVVLHNNVPTQFGTFTQQGHIFGTDTPGNTADDERYTRAAFFALAQGDQSIAGTYGTLHLSSSTGQWDYTLNSALPSVQALAQGQSVIDSFNAFAVDQYNLGGGQQTINVTVNGSNDAPVAIADAATTTEHQPVPIEVLANDTDVDNGAVLSVVSASAPAGQGTASVSGNEVRFNPGSDFAYLAPGEHATVTLSYTMSDEHGAQSSSTLNVTVTGEADPDGVVYEDGSRRANGQLSTVGLDDSQPLTAVVTGTGPGAAAPMANYHFLVDNLNIVRNGTQVFNDGFSTNQPGTPDGTFAGATVSYGLTGTFIESGGRAIMDGTNAFSTAFGTMAHVATLATDATNSTTGGLKIGDSFTVEGRFDLVMPTEEHQEYGIRLSDSVNGVGNDIVEVAVRRENGGVVVVLRDIDQGATSSTATILETRSLDLQPGDNQITLRLNHLSGSDAITGSFTLSGGVGTHGDVFTTQGHIFSNESWTRAAVVSIAPQIPQNGTYGNLSVDSDGGWVYQTKNNLPGLQALAQDERANDVFNVQLTDAHGATQTQIVTVAATGSNDAPVITGGVGNATVMEGHVLTASGQLTASDPDHGAILHWSVGDHFFSTPTFSSGYDGRYHFLLDELQVTKNGNTGFFDDNFNDGAVQPPASSGFSYGISGLVGEADGRAVYDGSGAVALRGPGIDDLRVGILEVLNSNINSVDTQHGLKSTDSFTATARFDLPQADDSFFLPTVPHAGQGYGIALVDAVSNSIPQDSLGDDGVFLTLEGAADGSLRVVFADRNVLTDEITPLGSMALPTVAGATQIEFHLSHDPATTGVVHASFDLKDSGGGVLQTFAFAEVGHIFGSDTPGYTGDDENWTRVQIVTTSPDTGGPSVHGTYGTLSIDDTGRWTYVLDNSPAVDNLTSGQFVTDTFAGQVSDEYGLSTARPISITIQGTDPGQAPIFYFGSQADETVTGTPAMDSFNGGTIQNIAGAGGSDTYVFHSATEGADTILDFLPGTGAGTDKIDIRDVLAGSYVPGVSNIADFVQVADFGDHSTLMVNTSGPAHTTPFVDLAILQNVTGQTLQSLLDNHNLVVS